MMSGEKHWKPYNILKGKSKVHVYLALVYTYPVWRGVWGFSPRKFENIECTIWHLEAHAQFILTTCTTINGIHVLLVCSPRTFYESRMNKVAFEANVMIVFNF
jgi:hypothetical protein